MIKTDFFAKFASKKYTSHGRRTGSCVFLSRIRETPALAVCGACGKGSDPGDTVSDDFSVVLRRRMRRKVAGARYGTRKREEKA